VTQNSLLLNTVMRRDLCIAVCLYLDALRSNLVCDNRQRGNFFMNFPTSWRRCLVMAVPLLHTMPLCCLSVFYERRAIKREYNKIIHFAVRDTERLRMHIKNIDHERFCVFQQKLPILNTEFTNMSNTTTKKLARCDLNYNPLQHPILCLISC